MVSDRSSMNDTEQECIILNSAWEMIDGMVNWAMFVKNVRTEPTNLMFETNEHSLLFIILLGDFLSPFRPFKGQPVPLGLNPPPSNAQPTDLTFLFYLRQVCANPKFAPDATDLSRQTEAFATWLEGDFIAPSVNLHSINVVTDLRVPRYRYIKVCGDITKHNLARLSTNVGHIRALLEASGHPISEQEGYLASGISSIGSTTIFYHSRYIAEFLNNIRWAIFDYLQPEFARSYHPIYDATSTLVNYTYDIPGDCNEPVAQAMYWDLMNRVRARPWVHRFVVHDSFKRGY